MQSSSNEEESTKGFGIVVRMTLGLALVMMAATLSVRYAPANVSSMAIDLCATEVRQTGLVHFTVSDAEELEKVLEKAWARLGVEGDVPGMAPVNMPSGLEKLPVKKKKSLFIRSIIPHVLHVNRTIRSERVLLANIQKRLESGGRLKEIEEVFVNRVALDYKYSDRAQELIGNDPDTLLRELLGRVDEIPVSLVLGQAAIESAWGSSRFAIEGNNLFGQWVFSSKAGMAPKKRAEGANYSVAKYNSITDSVRAYMKNLNTLWAYEDLRKSREAMRAEGRSLDAQELAQGLIRYSIRRQEYVDEVRSIMRSNKLEDYDRTELADVEESVADSILIGVLGVGAKSERVDADA